MPDKTTPNPKTVAPLAKFFCAIWVMGVLLVMTQGVVEAGSFPHAHKAANAVANVAGLEIHRCPLLHHSQKEVCPLRHQAASSNGFVIKSCGGNPADGGISATGFSKETVAPVHFDDFILSLESRRPFMISSLYTPKLPDPLDHPPRLS